MLFFDPDVASDPYPHYKRWREEAPVFRDDETGQWVISRYEDVKSALKNPALFSSSAFADSPESAVALPLLSDDPPRHTQLRTLVNRAFTNNSLKDIALDVEQLSQTMAAQIAGGTVDISEAFTTPLPIAVISQMMGIPVERGDDFKRWSDALTGTSEAADMEARMPDIMEMMAFFLSVIPERRVNPGEDLISTLVTAEVEGESLTDEDIAGFSMLLLIAGNETTTNLLSNLLHHAADTPGLWQTLRDDRSLIDAAIEETLRFDAPVQFSFRTITEDTQMHGQQLRAGDMAILLLGSANRDSALHEFPEEFRLDRNPNTHMTFGHGIHFCIGAPLGRLEARLGLSALLDRFTDVQHAQQKNERTHSHMLRGFHHLWLELKTE
ncbi:MAG: cytochrome P450 [Halioglobus sp.]